MSTLAKHPLTTTDRHGLRQRLLATYGVTAAGFDVEVACRERIDYLKAFLVSTGLYGFVLGISGGVDSTTAGRMAQLACEELRKEGRSASFWAVRLPSGIQRDEAEAQAALLFIQADRVLTINIGAASEALSVACQDGEENGVADVRSTAVMDYHKGNIKARMRMAAQYHVAALYNAAVLGTDHNAEAVMGFFTKFGDGAADLTVLDGLNKRQVRACGAYLGAPGALTNKVPTADLEELDPGKTDESVFGFTYPELDDFLEGKSISEAAEDRILRGFESTEHKRQPIVSFGQDAVALTADR